jgi:hypothetical protein
VIAWHSLAIKARERKKKEERREQKMGTKEQRLRENGENRGRKTRGNQRTTQKTSSLSTTIVVDSP